jgi:hypothetical protein
LEEDGRLVVKQIELRWLVKEEASYWARHDFEVLWNRSRNSFVQRMPDIFSASIEVII